MSSRCQHCKKYKQNHSFSNNQLKKPKKQRRCKKCIKKNKPNVINKKVNKHQESKQIKSSNHNNDDASNEYNESDGLSLLEKLHIHSVGKSVFTEIHLAFTIKKCAEIRIQNLLERLFKFFPDTFVYHNIVIIASNDPSSHYEIFEQIKQIWTITNMKIIEEASRCYFPELRYYAGKISTAGVTLYNKQNTIQNSDISVLFANSKPNEDVSLHLNPGMKLQTLSSNHKEHKILLKCNSTIKKSAKIENEIKDEIKNIESMHASNIINNTDSLQELQKQLKSTKNHLIGLQKQFDEKKKRMKLFNSDKTLKKWNSVRSALTVNDNEIFDQNNLEKIVNILNKLPIKIKCKIDKKRGHGSHIILNINTKIITISKDMKNRHFWKDLDKILNHYTQQIENETNDDDLDQKIQEIENKEHQIVESIDAKQDSLERLICVYRANIDKHKIIIRKAERAFTECSKKVTKLMEDRIVKFEENVKSMECEFWNMELAPNKLILSSFIKEPFFSSSVKMHQQQIIKWICKNIHKYKDIEIYGGSHLFVRFVDFVINSGITWWVSVLRWMTLPVTITNLNILMKRSRESVTNHFSKMGLPMNEIDIIMIVTYFMDLRKYKIRPFQLRYSERKDSILPIDANNYGVFSRDFGHKVCDEFKEKAKENELIYIDKQQKKLQVLRDKEYKKLQKEFKKDFKKILKFNNKQKNVKLPSFGDISMITSKIIECDDEILDILADLDIEEHSEEDDDDDDIITDPTDIIEEEDDDSDIITDPTDIDFDTIAKDSVDEVLDATDSAIRRLPFCDLSIIHPPTSIDNNNNNINTSKQSEHSISENFFNFSRIGWDYMANPVSLENEDEDSTDYENEDDESSDHLSTNMMGILD